MVDVKVFLVVVEKLVLVLQDKGTSKMMYSNSRLIGVEQAFQIRSIL